MFIHFFLFFVVSIHSSNCWMFNNIKNGAIPRRHSSNGFGGGEITLTSDASNSSISFIYPGTKWCGTGSIADGYDDLGTEKEADVCCREHDYCSDIIEGGETKYNLTNTAYYTRLSCRCDLTFRQCLRDAQTKVAVNVGFVYFDILGTQCFREDYPVIACEKKSGWLNQKCVEYSYDETKEKRYQWFDVPDFN